MIDSEEDRRNRRERGGENENEAACHGEWAGA